MEFDQFTQQPQNADVQQAHYEDLSGAFKKIAWTPLLQIITMIVLMVVGISSNSADMAATMLKVAMIACLLISLLNISGLADAQRIFLTPGVKSAFAVMKTFAIIVFALSALQIILIFTLDVNAQDLNSMERMVDHAKIIGIVTILLTLTQIIQFIINIIMIGKVKSSTNFSGIKLVFISLIGLLVCIVLLFLLSIIGGIEGSKGVVALILVSALGCLVFGILWLVGWFTAASEASSKNIEER